MKPWAGMLLLPGLLGPLGWSAEPAAPPAAPAPAAEQAAGASRLGRLQGRAFLGRNRDVTGASVVVRPQDGSSPVFVTSTDSKGGFRVDALPDGSYEVRIERDGLVPVVKREVVLRYPFRAIVEVPMLPGVPGSAVPGVEPAAGTRAELTLRGRISEQDAAGLADISLRLVRPGGREDPRSVRSGLGGTFEISGLASGWWRLEAAGVGYLPVRASFDVAGGTEVEIRLVRQPADYRPSPLELMPPERPVPPSGLDLAFL